MCEASNEIETRLQGIGLSRGWALSRICLFDDQRHVELPAGRIEDGDVAGELARFKTGCRDAAAGLRGVQKRVRERIGAAEAEIFVAQEAIVMDSSLAERVRKEIDGGMNAEMAVSAVLARYEARLLALDQEYMRDRASDIVEVRQRILDALRGRGGGLLCSDADCQRGHDRVVVATELTPSLTVELDMMHTRAFLSERGGVNSHAAILARALGVPAVSGLELIRQRAPCGAPVLVDGTTGVVVLWPSQQTVSEYNERHGKPAKCPTAALPVPGFAVHANISLASQAAEAAELEAEGIGLYRTEMEVMAAGRLLSEEEWLVRFRAIYDAMQGRPVTFRILDFGSDKPLPACRLYTEDNPALGWRGARYLLDNPDVWRPQARALARMSMLGAVDVLYPMVVDLEQYRALRVQFDEATADQQKGEIRHGPMIEVPSACFQVKELLAEADFASVGTNDLTQYLFAVDRGNEYVAADYVSDHPVMWSMLQLVSDAAMDSGKDVSVCGEMAADPEMVKRLAELGFSKVSVSARRIGEVRRAIKKSVLKKESVAGRHREACNKEKSDDQ